MMPARLALALQADGWWARSDIIWHKPNPMPESVTDRPTSAHEHVFLLTKSARYYYDADAVRQERSRRQPQRLRSFKVAAPDATRTITRRLSVGMALHRRNLRNVWTIATAPYSEAHFATFPPALAERCIKAGTSERGCCSQCGKPWVRITERGDLVPRARTTICAHWRRSRGAEMRWISGRNRARDGQACQHGIDEQPPPPAGAQAATTMRPWCHALSSTTSLALAPRYWWPTGCNVMRSGLS